MNSINNLVTFSKDFINVLSKEGLKQTDHIMPPFYDALKLIDSSLMKREIILKL